MLTSLVSFQQVNVKKSENSVKAVNIKLTKQEKIVVSSEEPEKFE